MMKPHIKFGLLTGLASGVIFISTTLAGLDKSGILFFAYLFMLAFGLYLTIKESYVSSEIITRRMGLTVGMRMLLIAGVIDGCIIYPYCKFINHSYMTFARKFQIDFFEKVMRYDPKQLETFKSNIYWSVSPGTLAISELTRDLVFGFFICLLVTSFLKRNNKPADSKEF
ncbi:MAG: DUF4199 domain-containing protein [Sphingobacteriales bacterium]